jgi:hypothetical protein
MKGFIGVHRKLMQNAVWTDPNYLKLWMYCMFKASHKPHEQLVGNQKVQLEKGQFVTGREVLAEEMNRGVKPKQRLNDLTWFRYLKNLEKWEMLNIKSNNKFSVVTVANYEFYQGSLKKDEQQPEQQMNNKRTTDEQQMNTNNNVNKGNNDKKKDITSSNDDSLQIEFDEFWNIYKKKTDKKKSFEKFKAKRKGHSFEEILEGTKKYMIKCDVEGTATNFIKGPAVFLNGDCFLEEWEIYNPAGKTGTHKKQNEINWDEV